MTDNEFKFWAFLSYSNQDNCEKRPGMEDETCLCWGNWLHGALQNFSIPMDFAGHPNARGEIVPGKIGPIFQDAEERPENAELSEHVRQALEQSRCLIVICSPRSAKSLHVNEAVRYFKQLGRGNRILSIVIAGEPNASDGNKPDTAPAEECFVPSLRHAVQPDGILDTTRREGGHIFADARHGVKKREILATDHRSAETELEIAKLQLIAGLIGVGFYGLWRHEQKRRFVGFAEAHHQARQALSQLEEARNQVREAQNQALKTQGLPQDIQSQIQEAQSQAHEAKKQLQELQQKVRDTQTRLEETHHRAIAAESKVLEAQAQARAAQDQLEAARAQVREAQNKVLEIQNAPQDIHSQIQTAQNQTSEAQAQARNTQSQLDTARNEAQDAQNKFLEAQSQAREAQGQIQELQHQIRSAQNQLEEARAQLRVAQHSVSEADGQSEVSRNQTRQAENEVQKIKDQTRDARSQIQEIENKARKTRRLTRVLALIAVLTLLAASLAASIAWWQRKVARQTMAQAATEAVWKSDWTPPNNLDQERIRQALQTFGGMEQETNRLKNLDKLAASIPREEIPEALSASSVVLNNRQRSHFQKWLLIRLGWVSPESAMTNAGTIHTKIVNDDGVDDVCIYFQLAVLDNWMKTDLPAAFNWVCSLPDADSRQRALQKIIPALPANDFTNTLARLNDLQPAPGAQTYTLLFQRWAINDPVQAMQQRTQISNHDADGKMLCVVMTTWMKQQPDAALDWLKSQPDSESKNKALENCIDELAKTDAPQALTLAESLPDGIWRDTVIGGLFADWASQNLEAATIAWRQLPDGAAKEEARESVLNQRIVQAPASAAEDVKNLPPGDYRQSAVGALCKQWAATDAPAALAWAQSLPSDAGRDAALNHVVESWTQKDPQSAMEFASRHSELSGTTLGAIAVALSRADWSSATNWVENLSDGENKDAVLSALSATWAQKDPEGMATYALTLPAGDIQTRCLTAACCQLAVNDLPDVVKLLQQLPDAALRQTILEQAARNCDLPHINRAVKYVAAMPAGDDQIAAVKGLLLSWASTDPETALKWLCSFPETNAQPEQVQFVIKSWSRREPAEAANWLTNLPAGAAGEGITNAFLAGAVEKYPAFAAQWTQSATDETQRQTWQIQVARQWMKADSSAASNWINNLELPAETKQSLLSPSP